MKTADLIGPPLDAWVARAEGVELHTAWVHDWSAANLTGWRLKPDGRIVRDRWNKTLGLGGRWVEDAVYSPSTDWAQGGPIIERRDILLDNHSASPHKLVVSEWAAKIPRQRPRFGDTPLLAAMRARVAKEFGDEVPDDAAQWDKKQAVLKAFNSNPLIFMPDAAALGADRNPDQWIDSPVGHHYTGGLKA